MPRRYRFEHPVTEKSISIGSFSYLWAGLFGALYVWRIGSGGVLQAIAVNVAFGLGVVLVLTVINFVPESLRIAGLVCLVPIAIYLQGLVMISIVREGFKRRGWRRFVGD